MAEEPKEVKTKKEVKTLVVEQLPTQTLNRAQDENGNEFNLITRDEAMTLILEKVTKIEKAVA